MFDRLAEGIERAGADVAEHHTERPDREGPDSGSEGCRPPLS